MMCEHIKDSRLSEDGENHLRNVLEAGVIDDPYELFSKLALGEGPVRSEIFNAILEPAANSSLVHGTVFSIREWCSEFPQFTPCETCLRDAYFWDFQRWAKDHEDAMGEEYLNEVERKHRLLVMEELEFDFKYEVERKLGRGGFGTAFLIRERSTRKEQVVKFLQKTDLRDIDRFEQEGRILGELGRHRNIVNVLGAGVRRRVDPRPYLVFDFYEQGELNVDKYEEREAVELVGKCANGLAHAHEAGIRHRDIKPSNILLAADGEPVVSDFGIAEMDDGSSNEKLIGGGPCMAPEQRDLLVPFSVDTYSLGVVLISLLIKKMPEDPRSAIDEVRGRDLKAICHKAIHTDPDRRYKSGTEFRDEIERHLNGFPLHARQKKHGADKDFLYSPLESGWVHIKRHRVLASVLGAMAIAILGLCLAVVSEIYRRNAVEQTAFDDILQSAKFAGKQGQWMEMDRLLNRALETGRGNEARLKYMRIDPLDALGRDAERDVIIKELEAADLGKYKGKYLLWRATLQELKGFSGYADGFIKKAKATGFLTTTDEAFIAAIQETTFDESIEKLQEVVRLAAADEDEPYHYRANANLAMELMLTGRVDEARDKCIEMRALFPYDTQYPVLLGILDCLENNVAIAKSRISEMEFDEELIQKIHFAFDALDRGIRQPIEWGKPDSIQKFAEKFGAVTNAFSRIGGGSIFGIRMPRRERKLAQVAVPAVLSPSEEGIRKLAELDGAGEFKVIAAGYWMGKDFSQAERVSTEALETGRFMIPAFRQVANIQKINAIYHQDRIGLEKKYDGVKTFLEEFPEPPAVIKRIAAAYAFHSNDLIAADRILAGFANEDLDDTKIHAALVALKIGDYARAIRFVDGLDDSNQALDMTVGSIREKAIEGMRRVVEQN